MNEDKAKEICNAADLSVYTRDELREADLFVKVHALVRLREVLDTFVMPELAKEYITLMASANYGSVETDQFLMSLDCYPDWLPEGGEKEKS